MNWLKNLLCSKEKDIISAKEINEAPILNETLLKLYQNNIVKAMLINQEEVFFGTWYDLEAKHIKYIGTPFVLDSDLSKYRVILCNNVDTDILSVGNDHSSYPSVIDKNGKHLRTSAVNGLNLYLNIKKSILTNKEVPQKIKDMILIYEYKEYIKSERDNKKEKYSRYNSSRSKRYSLNNALFMLDEYSLRRMLYLLQDSKFTIPKLDKGY